MLLNDYQRGAFSLKLWNILKRQLACLTGLCTLSKGEFLADFLEPRNSKNSEAESF